LAERNPNSVPRKRTIPVVDLFAGPGGLGEGFARLDEDDLEFKTVVSVEKDRAAHRTLTLRTFYRHLRRQEQGVPPEYYAYLRGDEHMTRDALFEQYPEASTSAIETCLCKELGSAKDDPEIYANIETKLLNHKDLWLLMGGPPCQAYSIVGRSRMANSSREEFEADRRHYLYQEYLKILARFGPPIFVMENVKGILSSRLNGGGIFAKIRDDLSAPVEAVGDPNFHVHPAARAGYRVVPINWTDDHDDYEASDFILRAEDYGVPQKRHRVILLGIRRDLQMAPLFQLESVPNAPAVMEVLDDLPALRSQLSKEPDSAEAWRDVLQSAWRDYFIHFEDRKVRSFVKDAVSLCNEYENTGGQYVKGLGRSHMRRALREWYRDEDLNGACNHESRLHRRDDLVRYLFVSAYGVAHGESPKLKDFPEELLPEHKNAARARETHELFDDRFRVQLAHTAATTVTSHLAKDGHYCIHHDPSQCRSWTVREAARIQTFPDNYFFEGTRTQQYVQVGNAVPPLLARAIARRVAQVVRCCIRGRQKIAEAV
jgi:DNA (cytosine-5)-methyltransferase 1